MSQHRHGYTLVTNYNQLLVKFSFEILNVEATLVTVFKCGKGKQISFKIRKMGNIEREFMGKYNIIQDGSKRKI